MTSALSARSDSTVREVPAHPAGPLTKDQLSHILRRLRLHDLPDASTALRLAEQMRDHLREECSALTWLPAPSQRLVIVGDLHGHFNDLLRVLDTCGEPSPANQYLFNGDFVDRGDWGLEVLLTIFCLRLLHPDSCYLNRGNHESEPVNQFYGFKQQVASTYPAHHEDLYSLICGAFDQLPLCHIIGTKICVVHAGLPLESVKLTDIEELHRAPVPLKVDSAEDRIFQALLWSDPAAASGPSQRGAGCLFDQSITQDFLEKNGLRLIVRSHECVAEGYEVTHGGLVYTVFSASNYNNVRNGNKACVLVVGSDLSVTPGEPWREPYFRKRARQSLLRDTRLTRRDSDFWDGSEEQAVEQLRRRAGAVPSRPCKDLALEELRRLICLARPQLLEAFEEGDACQCGKVTPEEWGEVMRVCLRTPPDFPWLPLRRHLCRDDGEGLIAYVEFLLRFYSILGRRLADRWASVALGELSQRLDSDAAALFDRLDTSRNGVLSYTELRPLVRSLGSPTGDGAGGLPATRSEARAEGTRSFALFRRMDLNRTGFVTQEEWSEALGGAALAIGQVCARKHRLVEMRTQPCWSCFEAYDCNICGSRIWSGDSRRSCLRPECNYDLCRHCMPSRANAQEQWECLEAALRVVSRSHCTPVALLGLPAGERVGKKAFVEAVRPLLLREGSKDFADVFWDHVKQIHSEESRARGVHDDANSLSVDDVERYLTVRDAG